MESNDHPQYTGTLLPYKLNSRRIQEDKDLNRIVIGIDFGTTYAGVAYNNPWPNADIHTINSWPSPVGRETLDSRTRRTALKVRERLVLPALVNGVACDALPDTMSSGNIMTRTHAAKIGAVIDQHPEKRRTYMNACGGAFRSLGEVMIDIAFPEDPSKVWRNCRFAVVEKCAAPVIIGDAFLRFTETLTKFRSRLRILTTSPLKRLWKLCYVDVPLRRLSCAVDGMPVLASADTGSDVNLVSLDYARYRQWHIKRLSKDTGYVILADGTVKKVSGYVDVPLRIAGPTYPKRFYVLEGLMCDVLLGDGTLDQLDVFNCYADYFVEAAFGEGTSICHNINWRETIDRRLDEILRGEFPQKTATELEKTRLNRIGLRFIPSATNIRAWREALARALRHLDDREVTARGQAQQAMRHLTGKELQEAELLDRKRREKHRQMTNKIKRETDRFLGVTSATP